MATYNTRAIIIGRHNVGEADRILVLLTPSKGVIRGVAKGVRRIKSRLAGHLELFCESELMLAEGRNMDTVTSARLQHHLDVSGDYDAMRMAYLFAEMVNRLGGDNEPHEGLFELLHDAFSELSKGGADSVTELWFKLRLLDRLGYHPQLDRCVVCGTNNPDRDYAFSVELGGIVDLGCAQPGNHRLTKDQIKLWRIMMGHDLTTVRKIEEVGELSKSTLPICNAFYDYTFGKRFRSAEVLT